MVLELGLILFAYVGKNQKARAFNSYGVTLFPYPSRITVRMPLP